MTTPGFTLGYGCGMGYVPSPYEAGGSGWKEMYRAGGSRGQHSHEAGGSGQPHQEHTLDEEDKPPPIRPQVTLDSLNTRMGGLELQQRQIQGTGECPHLDFHPVASADPAELRGPRGRKPSTARGAVGIAMVCWIFPGTVAIS